MASKQLNINFDEGLTKLTINDDEDRFIYVNLTDYNIITRFEEAQKNINNKLKEYDDIEIKADGTANVDTEYATRAIKDITEYVEAQFDYIFNSDVSKTVFNGQSCLSSVGGVPLYERFILAIIPMIEKEAKSEKKQAEKNMKKYKEQAARFQKKI